MLILAAAIPGGTYAASNKPSDGNPAVGVSHAVYRTVEKITLDGRPDETCWTGAPWSSAFMEETATGFAGVTGDGKLSGTRFKALWNGTYELYLLIDVDDVTYHPDDAFRFVICEDSSTGSGATPWMGGYADGSDQLNGTLNPNGSVTWGAYPNRFATYALKRGAAGQGVRYASQKFTYCVSEKEDHSGYVAECCFRFTYAIASSSSLQALVNVCIDDFAPGQDASLYSVSGNENYRRYRDTPTYFSWDGLTTYRVGVNARQIRETESDNYARQANSTGAIWPNRMGTFFFTTALVASTEQKPDGDLRYTVRRTEAEITVDGIAEDAWNDVAWSTGLYRSVKSIGRFKAVWKVENGTRYIYFLVDVHDKSDLKGLYTSGGSVVDSYKQDGFCFQFNEECREDAFVLDATSTLGYYPFSPDGQDTAFVNAESFYGVRRHGTLNRCRSGAHNVSYPYFIDICWEEKGEDANGDSLGYLIEARYQVVTDTDEVWFNVTVNDGDAATAYYRYSWGSADQQFAFGGPNSKFFKGENAGTLFLSDESVIPAVAIRIGAAVRYDGGSYAPGETALRFETAYDGIGMDQLLDRGETVTAGILLIPQTVLTEYGLASPDPEALIRAGVPADRYRIVEGTPERDENGQYCFRATVEHIMREQYRDVWCAVGYLRIGDTVQTGTYRAADHARSVHDVAQRAIASGDYADSAEITAILTSYLA